MTDTTPTLVADAEDHPKGVTQKEVHTGDDRAIVERPIAREKEIQAYVERQEAQRHKQEQEDLRRLGYDGVKKRDLVHILELQEDALRHLEETGIRTRIDGSPAADEINLHMAAIDACVSMLQGSPALSADIMARVERCRRLTTFYTGTVTWKG
jgi:hypothetical protein